MATETQAFMAMKGDGYYSKSTAGAKLVIDGAAGLVLGALARMAPADDGTVFRATDMGAADGGTSLDLWRRVFGEVRRVAPSRPIEMIYTDLPRNDFSQLFRVIHGQTDLPSYLPEIPGLHVFASATSFHDQIVPAGSLDLGFSATASHYISKVPCDITGHVHMAGAKGSERAAYLAQGAADWQRMLLARARELKAGGRLVLVNFGIDDNEHWLGHTGGASMFETFNTLWRGMADEGLITAAEYKATNFPQVYRRQAEFIAPLEDLENPVHRAGLRLEHVEARTVPCPYAADFKRHRDAEGFARAFIPTLRSWSEPVFAKGLSPGRLPAARADLLNEFYGRYERLVAAAPEGHGMDYVHIYLVCRKLGQGGTEIQAV